MNLKHIWIVFTKELKDSFRDRKSVLSNILLPLILIPVMYYCMNIFMKSTTDEVENNMKIAIATNENMDVAKEFTKQNIIGEDKIQIIDYDSKESAKTALNEGDINCILVYADGFFENIEKGSISKIDIEYNSLKSASEMGVQVLNSKLMILNQNLATQKLISLQISPEILNLVSISQVDTSKELGNDNSSSSQMLMMIIPMYLVIVIVTAGVPLAVDVLAGERERNTFEALLSTKANRLSILLGKYLAILVFSIIAVVMSFIGLILGIVLNPEMFSTGEEVMSLATIFESMNVPIGALILSLLCAITLAVVFAGIQIAISTWAKTVKEAQTYLSYMSFPAMIIGFATMFMGAGDMQNFMAYIPIFNTVASLKMVLGGVINYSFLITSVIVNILFIVIVIFFIIRMFNNEKIVIK